MNKADSAESKSIEVVIEWLIVNRDLNCITHTTSLYQIPVDYCFPVL